MKYIQALANERFARSAAKLLTYACYFLIGFFALCTFLSFIGRQTFILHTSTKIFDHAIYAEEDHNPDSRGMTVHTNDVIHVWTGDGDQIHWTVQIGLFLMYAVHTVPIMLAFWFLSRVFSNVYRGHIFTNQNVSCLLYYGLLQCFTALFVPFAKLLICWITNCLSENRVQLSTGQTMLTTLVPSIAVLVAAYILHYGVHLQDEVDHTL